MSKKGKLVKSTKQGNVQSKPSVSIPEKDQKILQKVCDTIKEEKITTGVELEKRFHGDMEVSMIVRKYHKIVGATLFFVKTTTDSPYKVR